LSTQSASSAPVHHLDKALFWLRWLFLGGVALLALLAEETLLGEETLDRDRLLLGLGIGAAGNILLGLMSLSPRLDERTFAVLNVLLDSALTGLFFWAYAGAISPLLILGALTVVAASFRLRWRGLILAMLLLALFSLPPSGRWRASATRMRSAGLSAWRCWGVRRAGGGAALWP